MTCPACRFSSQPCRAMATSHGVGRRGGQQGSPCASRNLQGRSRRPTSWVRAEPTGPPLFCSRSSPGSGRGSPGGPRRRRGSRHLGYASSTGWLERCASSCPGNGAGPVQRASFLHWFVFLVGVKGVKIFSVLGQYRNSVLGIRICIKLNVGSGVSSASK